jgi:hypothetical protein
MGAKDLMGATPESWCCVDCGVNTAPGMMSRAEMEKWFAEHPDEGAPHSIGWNDEVYTVRHAVWKLTGLEPYGGCLCVDCLEKRIGRKLKPRDFLRNHPFNSASVPASERLRKRQKRR